MEFFAYHVALADSTNSFKSRLGQNAII